MGQLVCPRCGAFTSPTLAWFEAEVTVGISGGLATRQGKAMAVTTGKVDQPTYGVMVCQACEKRFLAEQDDYGRWSAVYPILSKPASEDIPEPIKSELEEAYLCFAVGAYRACLSMCETALEAVWRERKVSGLNDLRDKGIISLQLFERATEVRLWGNVAKHEPVPDAVQREDAEQLLTYLEALLDTVYIQPKKLSRLSQKREKIEKTKKST